MRLLRAAPLVLLAALLAARAAAVEPGLEPAPEGVEATSIARRADDTLRSSRTYMEATMTVVSPRLTAPRDVSFRSWDDRPGKRNFIRILSPAKDDGTGFLKLHPNLWMFVPRVERTVRIPPSMMLQPWMGSDFTNDDLVNESSDVDDYDHTLLGVDPAPAGHEGLSAYVVEYVPHDDAPVVWGKIIGWVETEHGTPLRQDFYDEDGERLRTMTFSDIRQNGSRRVPYHWSIRPLDKEGHETRIRIDTFDFDVELDEAIFTKRHLKRAR